MGIGGFSVVFNMMLIFSAVVFLLVIGIFCFVLVKSFSRWNQNNRSPGLTVAATVVSRRTDVSHHHHGSTMHHTGGYTVYYATFQVESGDRMELQLTGQEYGLLLEGDRGRLSFQGTRFLRFERE